MPGEKARIIRCGCEPVVQAHDGLEGFVDRGPVSGGIRVRCYDQRGNGDTIWTADCVPAEAVHVHTSACYRNGAACMNQPFGTSTQVGGR